MHKRHEHASSAQVYPDWGVSQVLAAVSGTAVHTPRVYDAWAFVHVQLRVWKNSPLRALLMAFSVVTRGATGLQCTRPDHIRL